TEGSGTRWLGVLASISSRRRTAGGEQAYRGARGVRGVDEAISRQPGGGRGGPAPGPMHEGKRTTEDGCPNETPRRGPTQTGGESHSRQASPGDDQRNQRRGGLSCRAGGSAQAKTADVRSPRSHVISSG